MENHTQYTMSSGMLRPEIQLGILDEFFINRLLISIMLVRVFTHFHVSRVQHLFVDIVWYQTFSAFVLFLVPFRWWIPMCIGLRSRVDTTENNVSWMDFSGIKIRMLTYFQADPTTAEGLRRLRRPTRATMEAMSMVYESKFTWNEFTFESLLFYKNFSCRLNDWSSIDQALLFLL